MERLPEALAGDTNYGLIGSVYSDYRRPDPRIARHIHAALGDAVTVLNVGAGAGSYEPEDREVTAVEPSATMRALRPAHRTAAIDAVAEDLPFPDATFHAAMGTFTIHQWRDLDLGLREVRRVTRGRIVLLTCDPARLSHFWLAEYRPEPLEVEARGYPPPVEVARILGGSTTVALLPIPLDCTDGFNEAYYGRPERLLDPNARRACSAWSFVDDAAVRRFGRALASDLASGAWDARHGHLRTQAAFEGSLILVCSDVS